MKMKKLLLMITLLAAMPAALMAQEKTAKVVENATSGGVELVFVYDNTTSGTDLYDPSGNQDKPYSWQLIMPSYVKKIRIDPSFADFLPTSTKKWFYGSERVTEIPTISNLNTSNVTDMEWMFVDSGITSLDLSGWETNNLTNMNGMFYRCEDIASLTFGENFNTEKVTDMSMLFCWCGSLPTLDVSMFNTSNVTNMSGMFNSCVSLPNLDVSNFDTSNVTDMSSMFVACISLSSLDLSGFDTKNVTDMNSMFQLCSSLQSLNISGFKTGNVTDMWRMFDDCSKLTSLDVSGFDTRNVTRMEEMFRNCSGLKSLTFGANFAKKSTTNAKNMFEGTSCRFIDFYRSAYSETDNVISAVNRSTSDDMFNGVAKTTVIYLPENSPAPSGDLQNVVYTQNNNLVCEDYYSEDKVDIELPRDFYANKAQYHRKMSTKYGTVVLPYDFTSNDDIQCYTLSQEHTKTMYFVPTETVPAHTPFLFEKKNSGDEVSFIMEDKSGNYGITINATKDTEVEYPYEKSFDIPAQKTVASDIEKTMTWTTKGYYVTQTVDDHSNTYYIANDKFYKADGALTLYPHRATFVGSWNYGLGDDDSNAPFLNVGILGADGEEKELTAIESAELFNTVNGISAIYDVQGRRLQQMQPGLNIVHMEDGRILKVNK